jgi:alginate O-acetyltransferase complex protein AlgI
VPFSSLNFLVILPLLLLVYWRLPTSLKRVWLLVASLIVYLAAGWQDLLLLVVVTTANWVSSALFPGSRRAPKLLVVADVAVLAWFKYRYFVAGLFGAETAGSLVIPLGISFYIFQLISYQVELLKGVLRERPTFFAFFLYIFFFPHHQSGPIMRPHKFLGVFNAGRKWNPARFRIGVLIFLWGLFKKVWIADWLASGLVEQSYRDLHQSRGEVGNVLLLAVVYGVQIYADFSGYSDIAVGLGRMFGFKLDRNFHQPYVAFGPSEFWRRWHVTLSQWLRDHIYIPLGGNRHGEARTLVNLMIVMLVGGLWHGAGWAFVLWGGLHGVYLVVERVAKPWLDRVRPLGFVLFQLLFMLAWIPFREPDIGAVLTLFSRGSAWVGPESATALVWLAGIVAFSWAENLLERAFPRLIRMCGRWPAPQFALAHAVLLLVILSGVRHETVFIYQRF